MSAAVPVHVVVDGPSDAPAVVLSGSLGSDSRMWSPQVEPLVAAGFRVVCYDHRGHGRSPVPAGPYTVGELGTDVVDLLDRLGLARVHFVGLSLGGMVGMWLGRHQPERLMSLTLCCTSVALGGTGNYELRAGQVRDRGTAIVAEAVVDRWFTPAWRDAHPDRVRGYRSMVSTTAAEGYAGCCQAIESFDLFPELPAIETPTLVLSGSDDTATPPEHGFAVAAAMPHGQHVVVASAAHLANVEQPTRVSEEIIEHVRAHTTPPQ
ncbi:3-oxoadipate enol-lactonase [Nocardia sp. NPDC056541]|uniref:3-oxoadipate enol-lactonase n=1 Tax=Nocardia sp. NPDC056541 TaxID=3345860 RepID=UPI00366AC0CA